MKNLNIKEKIIPSIIISSLIKEIKMYIRQITIILICIFFLKGVAYPSSNPLINRITPGEGIPGTKFTITGRNLGSEEEYNLVICKYQIGKYSIYSKITDIIKWTDTEIIATIPETTSPGSYVICIWDMVKHKYAAEVLFRVKKIPELIPTIDSVEPYNLYPGGKLIIKGKNFGKKGKYRLVLCEGFQEKSECWGFNIIKWSETVIEAEVPVFLKKSIEYRIWFWGTWKKYSNDYLLHPVASPEIFKVDPKLVYIDNEVTFKIFGRNLGKPEFYTLKFTNSKINKFISWEENEIVVKLSRQEITNIGLGECPISILSKFSDKPVVTFKSIQIKNRPPYIEKIIPSSARAGESIKVIGKNFIVNNKKGILVLGRNPIEGGGPAISVQKWTNTEIEGKLPDGYQVSPGKYYIYIYPDDYFSSKSNAVEFQILEEPNPQITFIEPSSGTPGTKFVIKGKNLLIDNKPGQLIFGYKPVESGGGIVVTVEQWKDTEIKGKIPSKKNGVVPGIYYIYVQGYDYNSKLRRSNSVKFQVFEKPLTNSYKKIALRAYNGKYVCADKGLNGKMVANRGSIGPWETFELIPKGGNKYALKSSFGKYVCADLGLEGRLFANRDKIGPWEKFEIIELGGGKIALRASNGKYVCADKGKSDILVADRDKVGPWEIFYILYK